MENVTFDIFQMKEFISCVIQEKELKSVDDFMYYLNNTSNLQSDMEMFLFCSDWEDEPEIIADWDDEFDLEPSNILKALS